MEELTENAEEGDEEDKQSEQKLGRLNFKVSSRVSKLSVYSLTWKKLCKLYK